MPETANRSRGDGIGAAETELEPISWTELKEVPVFVEKSGEIGGLNGRNRTRVLCCRRRDGVGLKTGDEQRPMVEKDRQQKRTDGAESRC